MTTPARIAEAITSAAHPLDPTGPHEAIAAMRDVIANLPEVDNAATADALYGPWRVEAVGANGEPVDVFNWRDMCAANALMIRIVRAHPTGSAADEAYTKVDFAGWSDEEIQGEYLRAQAMCAGLNLASIANGIHNRNSPEE